jgi:hypothetical protein
MFTGKSQKNLSAARQYFDEHLSQNDYYWQKETQAVYWIGAGAEQHGLKNDTAVTQAVPAIVRKRAAGHGRKTEAYAVVAAADFFQPHVLHAEVGLDFGRHYERPSHGEHAS